MCSEVVKLQLTYGLFCSSRTYELVLSIGNTRLAYTESLFFACPFGMMPVADFCLVVVVAGAGWCNAIKAEL
jgi:hypothetical protein